MSVETRDGVGAVLSEVGQPSDIMVAKFLQIIGALAAHPLATYMMVGVLMALTAFSSMHAAANSGSHAVTCCTKARAAGVRPIPWNMYFSMVL